MYSLRSIPLRAATGDGDVAGSRAMRLDQQRCERRGKFKQARVLVSCLKRRGLGPNTQGRRGGRYNQDRCEHGGAVAHRRGQPVQHSSGIWGLRPDSSVTGR